MKKSIVRYGIYILGMAVLALGITLNTKVTLGVSPIVCLPYAVSQIWELNFGDMTFLWYSFFVVIELILHAKTETQNKAKKLTFDLAQIPVSLIFTRFMNLLSDNIPVFETAYPDAFPGNLWGRVLLLLAAIALTGIGAALVLRMRVIPNPADGVVQAISDCSGKSVSITKNIFDLTCAVLAIVLSLSVTHRIIGVGIGTLLAVLGTGRALAATNYFLSFIENSLPFPTRPA